MKRRATVAMASTASGGLGLLAIAWLAARRLSGGELGFFFSFLSFGALVQLGDFGLSYATLQTAGRLAGTDSLHELPSLAKRVRVWNVAASFTMTAIVAAVAWATFSARTPAGTGAQVTWSGPWAAYLLAVFANQLTVPGIALREGSGKITQMWWLRLVQQWASSIACLLALHFGASLWSLSFLAASRAAVAATWVWFGDPLRASAATPFSVERWMSEVWPFQWKIGLSGVAGFFIFWAFSPILLLEQGAVPAGQFGLAVSMMNLLIAISSAWPMSRAARYAALNASRRFDELRHDFPVMLTFSTALSVLGAASLSAALWQSRRLGFAFALKLPDTLTTSLVVATAVVHHVIACFAVYLRAEGREPLLVASVAGSVATGVAIWLTAHFGTLWDVAVVNLICALFGIPIVLVLFWPRWRLMKAAQHACKSR